MSVPISAGLTAADCPDRVTTAHGLRYMARMAALSRCLRFLSCAQAKAVSPVQTSPKAVLAGSLLAYAPISLPLWRIMKAEMPAIAVFHRPGWPLLSRLWH